jgi:hypothetical protein
LGAVVVEAVVVTVVVIVIEIVVVVVVLVRVVVVVLVWAVGWLAVVVGCTEVWSWAGLWWLAGRPCHVVRLRCVVAVVVSVAAAVAAAVVGGVPV